MNLSTFIARRYFISRKSQNAINIISIVAMVGVGVGTMALVVVLSVFNGFENLVISLYNSFDADLKITLAEGKTFTPDESAAGQIKKLEGVAHYCEVIEENALLKYKDKQYIATLKGVGDDFNKMTGLDTMIREGAMVLKEDGRNYAIVGQGVAYGLSLTINDFFNPITVYAPKAGKVHALNPEADFESRATVASGIFSIQYDFDSKYVIVPLAFARDLLNYPTQVSAIEIDLKEGINEETAQETVQKIMGNNFVVKTKYQQHELLYKIMKSEKWAVFLILSFILIIATFNVVSSLTMLIIEKKKDIGILKTMGANDGLIGKIFLTEGLFITNIGALLGLLLGAVICFVQKKFGIIKLHGDGSFVVDAYPVDVLLTDFVYVFLTVLVIGLIAAWLPVRQMQKTSSKEF